MYSSIYSNDIMHTNLIYSLKIGSVGKPETGNRKHILKKDLQLLGYVLVSNEGVCYEMS